MPHEYPESVWEWRTRNVADRTQVTASGLRRAAFIQATVMAVVGALLVFVLGHRVVGYVVWGLGTVSLLLGVIHPPAYRPLHSFGQWLGRMVGGLLLYLLLVPFYYLFFFPVSLLLRIQKRDPLQRRFRAEHVSYWIPRRQPSPVELYERQFMREDKKARGLRRPVATGDVNSEEPGA